jgi:EmrB/QacA subfamily drug resistance transporter
MVFTSPIRYRQSVIVRVTQRSARETGKRSAGIGVVVICAAHFLIGVDGLAVAIALPAVQRDLGVAPIEGQWLLSAYGLAFGGTLLLGGRLGDLYGRRRALVGGLAAFAVGALAASLAPGLITLIGARVLQGFGAASAVPSTLALIGTLYPPGGERTRALSLLAAMASLGTMSGLVLGGAVTGLLGWRWLFAITALLAAAATPAARRLLPEARAQGTADRLDALGAVLVTAAMLAILLALTRIEHHGVASMWVVAPLLGGLGLMAAFVAHERRAASPLLRLGILRVRSLRAASLGAGLNAVAFTAIVYVGTLYLQLALDYSPLQAGLALLPLDAVAFVVPLAGARAIARRAPRSLLFASFTLTALALLWLARAPLPADYLRDVLGPLIVLGTSLSVAFVVLTQEAVADVSPDERGLASGIFETANHLFGGAIGVALYATLLTATATAGHANGYRSAFLAGAGLAFTGLLAAHMSRAHSEHDEQTPR